MTGASTLLFNAIEHDVQQAQAIKSSVVDVFRAVYSLPPYNESDADVQRFADSWLKRTEKPGFIFFGAKDGDGHLVGFCYGWRSVTGDSWNIKLLEQVGQSNAHWLTDCFEFVDLAVLPPYQGFGLGRDLTKKLFSKVPEKNAVLLTHQTTTKASLMYLRNGWVELKGNFEVAPGKIYQIMGKRLRQQNGSL